MTDYIDLEDAALFAFDASVKIQNSFISHNWKGDMVSSKARQIYQKVFFDFLTESEFPYSYKKRAVMSCVDYSAAVLDACSLALQNGTGKQQMNRQKIADEAAAKIYPSILAQLLVERAREIKTLYLKIDATPNAAHKRKVNPGNP